MKKHIALISMHASPLAALGGVDSGGQNVYVAQVARHLTTLGYSVDIFTRRDSEELPEIVQWANDARIVHVPAGPLTFIRKEELMNYVPAFGDYVTDFFRNQHPGYDLVHANFWLSGMAALHLKERLGVPFVVTFHALGRIRRIHQGEADQFPDARFTIEERIMAEAAALIPECPQDETDMVKLYGADPMKMTIIPCGFDPSEFWPMDKSYARKQVGLPLTEPIILQLGRMVPRKGVETVIRGFANLVRDRGMPARLVVVGGESEDPDPELTPEIGRLLDVAREEGVADRVIFTGSRRRGVLRYYYNAADIFATVPWYEPFGITPVEAMACARPVIGAAVGGIQYTVVDGKTGYHVPPKDPEALGERLADLLGDPERLNVFSHRGHTRANELFTWQKVADSIAYLYEDVLAGAQPALDPEPAAILEQSFAGLQETLALAQKVIGPSVVEAAEVIGAAFSQGGKLLTCGNGGSAADAQHLACELVGRFNLEERQALPAMALTADAMTLTAWSNDVGYESVFSRQIEAFGQRGDVLVGISTSGNSENLLRAFDAAHARGITCVALLGGDGGKLLPLADVAVVVPSADTQRIQELHTLVLHQLCELLEVEYAHPAPGEIAAVPMTSGGNGHDQKKVKGNGRDDAGW